MGLEELLSGLEGEQTCGVDTKRRGRLVDPLMWVIKRCIFKLALCYSRWGNRMGTTPQAVN